MSTFKLGAEHPTLEYLFDHLGDADVSVTGVAWPAASSRTKKSRQVRGLVSVATPHALSVVTEDGVFWSFRWENIEAVRIHSLDGRYR